MTRVVPAVALCGCVALLGPGCASFYLHRAPPSPNVPYQLAVDDSRPVRTASSPAIRSDHTYTLPELIDVAESSNPDTRIGWEKARQAALAVGIPIADYFPRISAITIAGYQHTYLQPPAAGQMSSINVNQFNGAPSASLRVPMPAQPSGTIGVDTFQVLPLIFVWWPVLDVGRWSEIKSAQNNSVAANATFTAEHQKIMFEVARAYFRLGAARAQVAVNGEALERTRAVGKSAQARYDQGLATIVELSQSRREVAQAEYDLSKAQADETNSYAALISVLGIDPASHLEVTITPTRELPARVEENVDAYVKSALASRPDLRAARARLPATAASVTKSWAAYAPRVSFWGSGGTALLGSHVEGQDTKTVDLPHLSAGVVFDWMLFDGGLRDVQRAIAVSKHDEAQQELVKLERQAVQEVMTAYNELNATLSRYRAAAALLTTATVADDATAKSYVNGLASYSDAMNAQKARALASAAKEQAFAEALIGVVSLAFASGQLTSAGSTAEVGKAQR